MSVLPLGKVGVKVIFDYDKAVMTKSGTFVGKGYYNKGLFILNVIVTSSAYLIDYHDLWHARIGHVNFSYIKKMKELGILKNVKITDNDKCQICSKAMGTKKHCKQVV